jgi:chromosome segregation ATPase
MDDIPLTLAEATRHIQEVEQSISAAQEAVRAREAATKLRMKTLCERLARAREAHQGHVEKLHHYLQVRKTLAIREQWLGELQSKGRELARAFARTLEGLAQAMDRDKPASLLEQRTQILSLLRQEADSVRSRRTALERAASVAERELGAAHDALEAHAVDKAREYAALGALEERGAMALEDSLSTEAELPELRKVRDAVVSTVRGKVMEVRRLETTVQETKGVVERLVDEHTALRRRVLSRNEELRRLTGIVMDLPLET